MFTKKNIKKTQNTLDSDSDQEQVKVLPIEKGIQKRRVGISVAQLQKEKQINDLQPPSHQHRNFLNEDQTRGLTNISYIKQRSEKPDKLMEKYVKDKIKGVVPLAYNGQEIFQEDEQQKDAELLDAIRNVQQQFLFRHEEKDPSFYVGGIIEVNLSLEEEARKMAQMEDLKRGQYLQTLIQGKPKRAPVVIIHPDEDEDKEEKAYKDLKYKFYQKGRIFKYQQMQRSVENAKFEQELADAQKQ